MEYHKPVLLEEVLAHLQVKRGNKYIDATLGDGGHTIEILRLGGQVLGIDSNQKSLDRSTQRIKDLSLDQAFIGTLGNFKDIDTLASQNEFSEVDGIIFDLGFSTSELEMDELGLSFQKDEPLDMRLDKSLGVTAADLLNALPEKHLEKLIREYSDEMYAKRIAGSIVKARNLKKIQTTFHLVDVIKSVTPLGYEHKRIHPATRTFQALRIAVNDELTNLKVALPRAAHILKPGELPENQAGRLIVISFHSLEDKLVKSFGQTAQPHIRVLTKKPIVPTDAELAQNVQARSAKMRVFEKV